MYTLQKSKLGTVCGLGTQLVPRTSELVLEVAKTLVKLLEGTRPTQRPVAVWTMTLSALKEKPGLRQSGDNVRATPLPGNAGFPTAQREP